MVQPATKVGGKNDNKAPFCFQTTWRSAVLSLPLNRSACVKTPNKSTISYGDCKGINVGLVFGFNESGYKKVEGSHILF